MTTQTHKKYQICRKSLQRVHALTTKDKNLLLTIECSPDMTKIAISIN